MLTYEYGNPVSSVVLLQMVDDHDLDVIENEIAEIKKTVDDFKLIAVKTNNWNTDLSPWKAPAAFGKEDFGGGATRTLTEILQLCSDVSRTYYIGGYSLAGCPVGSVSDKCFRRRRGCVAVSLVSRFS